MPSSISNWWRALRAYSFSATVIPVACAFLLSQAIELETDWSLFPFMLISALFLHAGVNLLNDYYDFILGFDTAEAHGSSGLLTQGLVSPSYMRKWGRGYVFAALLTMLPLVAARGWPVLAPGICGSVGVWFYSHPAGYKYKGLGEPLVFIQMGLLLFFTALYAAAGQVVWIAIFPAMICGSLVSSIMLANNIRDMRMDRQANFTTLPLRIGMARSKHLYAALIGTPFVLLIPLSIRFGAPLLLPVLSIWPAYQMVRKVLHAEAPAEDLMHAPQKSAVLYLIFGLLMALGLFLAAH